MTTDTTPRKCFSCGFETISAIRRCPKCKRGLRTSQQIRVVGMGLVVIGAGLSAGMAYLIWVIANIMRQKDGRTASSFTGAPQDTAYIFGILSLVLALGITSVSTGMWQVISGRPNRLLSVTVLVLGLVVVVVGVLFWVQR